MKEHYPSNYEISLDFPPGYTPDRTTCAVHRALLRKALEISLKLPGKQVTESLRVTSNPNNINFGQVYMTVPTNGPKRRAEWGPSVSKDVQEALKHYQQALKCFYLNHGPSYKVKNWAEQGNMQSAEQEFHEWMVEQFGPVRPGWALRPLLGLNPVKLHDDQTLLETESLASVTTLPSPPPSSPTALSMCSRLAQFRYIPTASETTTRTHRTLSSSSASAPPAQRATSHHHLGGSTSAALPAPALNATPRRPSSTYSKARLSGAAPTAGQTLSSSSASAPPAPRATSHHLGGSTSAAFLAPALSATPRRPSSTSKARLSGAAPTAGQTLSSSSASALPAQRATPHHHLGGSTSTAFLAPALSATPRRPAKARFSGATPSPTAGQRRKRCDSDANDLTLPSSSLSPPNDDIAPTDCSRPPRKKPCPAPHSAPLPSSLSIEIIDISDDDTDVNDDVIDISDDDIDVNDDVIDISDDSD